MTWHDTHPDEREIEARIRGREASLRQEQANRKAAYSGAASLRNLRGCESSACNQGRLPCPTPEACHEPAFESADKEAAIYLAVAIAAVASLIGLVLWLR